MVMLSGCTAVPRADASKVSAPPRAHAPVVTAAPVAPKPTTTTAAAPSPSSLTVEPAIEARLDDNFNPFDTSSTLGQMGVPDFVYEPLIEFNELQVDQYYPWLAESWSFSLSGQTITFDLRPGVTWDDGSPFTAADVAYTFNLVKQNPALGYGLPIVSAVATNAMTFTLTLSQPGYALLYNIARVPIVKNGYGGKGGPLTYLDTAPDGTGPYELARPGDAGPHRVVLTGRDHYWQPGEPAVHQLVFPSFSGLPAVAAALQTGALDWAGNFMPTLASAYLDRDASANHAWLPTVDCISLELNLSYFPLDRLAVRRAISAAIDRDDLSQSVEGGYAPPATSSSGLVLPTDSQYLTSTDTTDLRGGGDLAMADQLMTSAGYHRNSEDYWANKVGDTLSFTIEAAAGTPLASVAVVISQELQGAGFDAAARPRTIDQLGVDTRTGHFDAVVMASATGPSPYYMYENWLDPSLLVKGQALGGDYVRLAQATDPRAARAVAIALDDYTDNPSDSAQAAAALRALGKVVSEQVPVVPLLYGVAWAEFSTRNATGWPSSQNAYDPASPVPPFAEYTVLQLSPTPG
jgi:peptide/nickel transport system substrate-binding protein